MRVARGADRADERAAERQTPFEARIEVFDDVPADFPVEPVAADAPAVLELEPEAEVVNTTCPSSG